MLPLPRKLMFDNARSITMVSLPILGKVIAGTEKEYHEIVGEYKEVYHRLITEQNKHDFFLLAVEGDSMCDCQIYDGNTVIVNKGVEVRNNDIAVVSIDEQKTVKRFFHRHKTNEVELVPCNPNHKTVTLPCEDVEVVGKVVSVRAGY